MSAYLYLHGFASGPRSRKAQRLHTAFAARHLPLQRPDLNQPSFTTLTLTRQIEQTLAELATLPPGLPVTLIGSSLGGLTAAWVAERSPQVERLILLAPAFEFLAHWLPRLGAATLETWQSTGTLAVYHYQDDCHYPLHYEFLTDAQRYDEPQLQRSCPTLILHGREDEVIPLAASQRYTRSRPAVQLIELDSDHALANVEAEIWAAIAAFCHLD